MCGPSTYLIVKLIQWPHTSELGLYVVLASSTGIFSSALLHTQYMYTNHKTTVLLLLLEVSALLVLYTCDSGANGATIKYHSNVLNLHRSFDIAIQQLILLLCLCSNTTSHLLLSGGGCVRSLTALSSILGLYFQRKQTTLVRVRREQCDL